MCPKNIFSAVNRLTFYVFVSLWLTGFDFLIHKLTGLSPFFYGLGFRFLVEGELTPRIDLLKSTKSGYETGSNKMRGGLILPPRIPGVKIIFKSQAHLQGHCSRYMSHFPADHNRSHPSISLPRKRSGHRYDPHQPRPRLLLKQDQKHLSGHCTRYMSHFQADHHRYPPSISHPRRR